MRTLTTTGVVALGLLLLAACVPSVQPYFTDSQLTTDATLVGAWGDKPEGPAQWTVKADPAAGGYLLTGEKGKTVEARLFKMGDQLYFDFAPPKDEPASGEANFLPVHTMARVQIEKDRLRVAFLNPDKVDALLKAQPDLIAHAPIKVGDNPAATMLVAPTPAIQDFILKHQDKVFADPVELFRIAKSESPAQK